MNNERLAELVNEIPKLDELFVKMSRDKVRAIARNRKGHGKHSPFAGTHRKKKRQKRNSL